MEIAALHQRFLESGQVSTDSRNIPQGCIFFALKGERFNGNTFALQALEEGAAWAVVDEPGYSGHPRAILVEDALASLQQLATYHRQYCGTRIIALTGSNGKTTTKELIAAVLEQEYRIIATRGNLNNHIGVPLTLLRLQPETELAVVEMGANHQGEIDFLCRIALPDFGYITNFGKAHLEGFGGVEGVIKGKSEMYRRLMADQKTLFLNADDPIQREKLQGYARKVGFSTTDTTYFPIRFLGADPHVHLELEGVEIRTHLMGAYNFTNCAVAALIGHYFNVPLEKIRTALEGYRAANNRSQVLQRGTLEIILDAYNANPSSMEAALDQFGRLDAPRKTAILGDMFELGEDAPAEHLAIGKKALEMGLDAVYLVGTHFDATGLPARRYPDFESLAEALKVEPLSGPGSVLIKASRGMALERLLEQL
ncbi:UDP-N-acetylmuramoyl-tripeptide--D-alanyl-D-alanine ligase [Robiginitalea sp. M366]|uniref:UDP-N-acetylmuramoyl-tripeptide--D-alanyl-D- alanine ligase n=1 Tax=Robiginitalea aestuariiviva TaxID=3036903 RepID=UPI00240DE9D0|nr:UDP-N-acetylmuramoyl-tripeptide--D-alanyl-D-alanine ligase [Robiginitalea aestuariiviva]MDG1572049.1 UDP-N-acetylmuramoyl-tripeptide--D-alanyl-D-alanine ligase [Robiginitalea aestuariiviva]